MTSVQTMDDNLRNRLAATEVTFDEILVELADPDVLSDQNRYRDVTRKHSSLKDVVDAYPTYLEAEGEIEEAKELVEAENDPEMLEFLRETISANTAQLEEIETGLRLIEPLERIDAELDPRTRVPGAQQAARRVEQDVCALGVFLKMIGLVRPYDLEHARARPWTPRRQREVLDHEQTEQVSRNNAEVGCKVDPHEHRTAAAFGCAFQPREAFGGRIPEDDLAVSYRVDAPDVGVGRATRTLVDQHPVCAQDRSARRNSFDLPHFVDHGGGL